MLVLTSCYKIDPLPDRIKSDYEFAIPIVDTVVTMENVLRNQYHINDTAAIPEWVTAILIPEGETTKLGEITYPFYIGEYASSQEVKWLEPRIILNAKNFPSGAVANIQIYTKQNDSIHYFWLDKDHSVTLTNTTITIPETPINLTNIEDFRYSRSIYMNVFISYPEQLSMSDILSATMSFKLAIKFGIKTDLTIKL
jgi:hypothetical protein